MTDRNTQEIADFAHALKYEDIPESVRRQAVRSMIDTLACALGAVNSKVNAIVSELAPSLAEGQPFGRVIGSLEQTTPDIAAFQNAAMIRNLDYNDTYPGGHASEALGALLAVGGAKNISGQEFLRAMVATYEVHNRISKSGRLRFIGWDHSTQIGISATAGLGNMLGLSHEALRHAISLATVAAVSLRVTRSGHLSDWTASATGQGARDAVFLTALAERGITAPPEPFEGRHGMWEMMSKFDLDPLPVTAGGEWLTSWMRYKFWPAELNAQISIAAARELREKVSVEDIEEIVVWTYHWAYFETASEREKWEPRSADTANHSLPYLVARMLLVGEVGLDAFEEPAFTDPKALQLMQKIRVEHDPAMDDIYPETVPVRFECKTRSGEPVVITLENPRGHPKNPMTDAEFTHKFSTMAASHLTASQTAAALDFWWNVEGKQGIAEGLDLLAGKAG